MFIGGLPHSLGQRDLEEYFRTFGNVTDCYIPKGRDGRPKGVAFISFETEPELSDAISNPEHTVKGETVNVCKAVPRPQGGGAPGVPPAPKIDRLYIGSLPEGVSKHDLQSFFAEHGEVTDTYIPRDRNTDQPKGFAFLTFASPSSVEKLCSKPSYEINGHEVAVEAAQPRPDRGGKGGGFGASGGGFGDRGGRGGGGYGQQSWGVPDPYGGPRGGRSPAGYNGGFNNGGSGYGGGAQYGGAPAFNAPPAYGQGGGSGFGVPAQQQQYAAPAVGGYVPQGGYGGAPAAGGYGNAYGAPSAGGFGGGGYDGGYGAPAPGSFAGQRGPLGAEESSRLYVVGISDVPTEAIKAHFEQFGTVTDVYSPSRPDGSSRGFTFVTFADGHDAHTARARSVKEIKGHVIKDIRIAEAKPGKGGGASYGRTPLNNSRPDRKQNPY